MHAAELEAENTALANSLVACLACPREAPAKKPDADAGGQSSRAATALRKPDTGSQSGTLAELPALTNAADAQQLAVPVDGGIPVAGAAAAPGLAAPHAGSAGAPKDKQEKPEHTSKAAAAMPEEVAEPSPAPAGGEIGGQGDGGDADDVPQLGDEAVSAPCASSAGKRKRTPGPGEPARKAARDEGSASPGRQRQQRTAPGSAAREASPAGEQRAQKHRILDLSHIRSFAQTARGALDQLRGAGPRRRTADVTLKSKAVRPSRHSKIERSHGNTTVSQMRHSYGSKASLDVHCGTKTS